MPGLGSWLASLLVAGHLAAAEPTPVVDGAWLGAIELDGAWTLAVGELKLEQDTLTATLSLPFDQREGLKGKGEVRGDSVRFEVSDRTGTLRFEAQIVRRELLGRVQQGERSGGLRLYRQMDPKALTTYMGFYRGPDRRLLYLQPWDEMGGQLMSLDEAGELRFLYPAADDAFVAGNGALPEPVAVRYEVSRSPKGELLALRRTPTGAATESLEHVELFDSEDVSFNNGAVKLAGTLFIPRTKGPHPAVVLTHGSGPQDRTAGQLFAAHLLGSGIAVLAYDKRGVGGSTGEWTDASFDDLAGDALAGVALLKQRKDINARQIGVWGLSQGGWIGPLAAARSEDVAFVVAISAAAVTPERQELIRTEHEMRADGVAEADIQQALEVYILMNKWVRTGQGREEYLAARRKVAEKPWWPGGCDAPPADDPYFRFWRKVLDYDPVPVLKQVTCPILVVYGGVDQNVRPEDNQPIMERALAGNRDHRIVVYPQGNHVMIEARSGSTKEMLQMSRFVPGYMELVRDWVLQRVALPK